LFLLFDIFVEIRHVVFEDLNFELEVKDVLIDLFG